MFNQSLLVLDLIGTWLGLGIMGFGTKGLGTGLDNSILVKVTKPWLTLPEGVINYATNALLHKMALNNPEF